MLRGAKQMIKQRKEKYNMPNGFDLTDIQPVSTGRPPLRPTPAKPTTEHAGGHDVDIKSMDEALHKPPNEELYDEEGNPWKDKRPPGLKRSLWSVDKFIEPGGMLRDKNGNPIIRSSDMPKASREDRKELNGTEA